jgi:phosphate transport system protein
MTILRFGIAEKGFQALQIGALRTKMKNCIGRSPIPRMRIAARAAHLALCQLDFAMSKHLQRDIDSLNTELLSISSMVEEMIDKATQALASRRYDLADEVVKSDEYVDRHEVHVEEECLKMLALHQPVASDLRRIATVMKVNNDLERIADLAVSIAQRAQAMDEFPAFTIPDRLPQMVVLATQIVRGAMNALVNMDTAAARRIIAMDKSVDQYNRDIIAELEALMQKRPENVPPALHCFSAVRHVERIADHATNIAEDVIYLAEGDIVRHRHETETGGSEPPK